MGCAEGRSPFAGSLRVSLRTTNPSPFLARKGVRGMVVPMAIGISTLLGMAWSTRSPFQLVACTLSCVHSTGCPRINVGRVQRGWNPLWQGSGGTHQIVKPLRVGGWE